MGNGHDTFPLTTRTLDYQCSSRTCRRAASTQALLDIQCLARQSSTGNVFEPAPEELPDGLYVSSSLLTSSHINIAPFPSLHSTSPHPIFSHKIPQLNHPTSPPFLPSLPHFPPPSKNHQNAFTSEPKRHHKRAVASQLLQLHLMLILKPQPPIRHPPQAHHSIRQHHNPGLP